MTSAADLLRQAQTRQAIAELRSLQERLNQTIERLCELGAGALVQQGAEGAEAARWVPPLLLQPALQSVWSQPANGATLQAGTRFYCPGRQGLVQVIQQPRLRDPDGACVLALNWADVGADWMSLVFDARELLDGSGTGRARLELQAEVLLQQAQSVFVKCAWKLDNGKWQERTVELRDRQPHALVVEFEAFDPVRIQALDVHLVVRPGARGSVELRHLLARLLVGPEANPPDMAGDVFEVGA